MPNEAATETENQDQSEPRIGRRGADVVPIGGRGPRGGPPHDSRGPVNVGLNEF